MAEHKSDVRHGVLRILPNPHDEGDGNDPLGIGDGGWRTF